MTAALVVALALAGAIALPHRVALERAPAGLASAVWLSALGLRALASLAAVVAVEVYLPVLEPLRPLCVSHASTDALFALPALVLAGSLVAGAGGLFRASWAVRRLVARTAVGPGPDDSLIVADGALLLAVAGLRKPRVIVSAGALVALDDEELGAGLDHERGHIALKHRYLLVAGELARALGRFLPGTQAAARELTFSLERHADCYALARRHQPAVLASAICKTAQGSFAPPALALGGGVVARRARLLLEDGAPHASAPHTPLALAALAPCMVALVVAGAIALPFAAHAGYHTAHRSQAPVPTNCRN